MAGPLPQSAESALKQYFGYVAEVFGKVHGNALFQSVRQLFEMPSIGFRQNQLVNFLPACSDDFFAYATDRQYVPRKVSSPVMAMPFFGG